METRKFILMRNPDYAETISEKCGYIIRKTESEILGVIPKDGDCFIIDAHYKGLYADIEILKLVQKLVENISDCNITIEIYCWLPEHYLRKNYNIPIGLFNPGVIFKQFPI